MQLLEIRYMPRVYLPEGSHQDLRNLTFPSLPDEHIEIVCWSGTHEEQLAEAKPILQHEGSEAYQQTPIVAHCDQP